MKLMEIIAPGAVVAKLQGATRDDVIRELIDALVKSGAAAPAIRDELVARGVARRGV